MPVSALALLVLAAHAAPPVARPPSIREMGAFLLGQYAKNVEAKLGKPARTGTDADGETLWFYDLAPGRQGDAREGPGTVLVFSISQDENPHITMIEVNGGPTKTAPTMLGVALGMSKADLLKTLGPADETAARTPTPGETFDWSDRNYYIETDATGRVDCIQILLNNDRYPKIGDAKPDLEGFRQALESRDRATILEWLCADLDVYTKTDETVNFDGSAREDILNEESLISRYVYGGSGSVRDLLTPALVRGATGEADDEDETSFTSTFPEGSPIVNIVWNFEAGRWRVWEIDLAPEEESRR